MQHAINILMLVVPVLYVTLQTLVLRQWGGFHHRLALLPLAGWAVWGAVLGYRVWQGADVRPALPGEIVTFSGLGLIYLGTLALMRRIQKQNPE